MKCVIDIPKKAYEACLKLKSELDEDGILGFCLINAVANCELLPKGHGRLIDADALVYWECNGDCDMCCDDDKCGMVKEAPTIIEADKAESEDKEC